MGGHWGALVSIITNNKKERASGALVSGHRGAFLRRLVLCCESNFFSTELFALNGSRLYQHRFGQWLVWRKTRTSISNTDLAKLMETSFGNSAPNKISLMPMGPAFINIGLDNGQGRKTKTSISNKL